MNYNLFLDDVRNPSDCVNYMYTPIYTSVDWIIVRTYDEFVKTIIENGLPEIISFDHDLADEHYSPEMYTEAHYNDLYDEFKEKTGYDCAKWLVNYCMDNNVKLPETILVHSMNPVGRNNIKSYFKSYKNQK